MKNKFELWILMLRAKTSLSPVICFKVIYFRNMNAPPIKYSVGSISLLLQFYYQMPTGDIENVILYTWKHC